MNRQTTKRLLAVLLAVITLIAIYFVINKDKNPDSDTHKGKVLSSKITADNSGGENDKLEMIVEENGKKLKLVQGLASKPSTIQCVYAPINDLTNTKVEFKLPQKDGVFDFCYKKSENKNYFFKVLE